uniref:Phosphate-specific transport system accessory protein PhoU n=1 Tax=uncultured bacterium contig00023 TaxID=1181512 RepID=A0A806KIA1_9BACT|nr:phosphate transport system regulatory protein PhoU [uncultured bacterium contig00023]
MGNRFLFSEELNQLRHNILAMSTRVEENLGKALAALRTSDAELAKQVSADDAEVDALQRKIEDDAATVIATQQPVARDLRELVSIFKITGNIERVGDHAVHLSKAAKKLAKRGDSPFRAQKHLEKMAETGQGMLRAAVSAFMAQDSQAARDAAKMDCIIDAEHEIITEDILKLMKKHPDLVKGALQILRTANQLERLGDHICNICEAVIYMIEGIHEELNE